MIFLMAMLYCMPIYMPPAEMRPEVGGRIVGISTALLQRRLRQLGVSGSSRIYGAWIKPLDTTYVANDIPQVCQEAVLRHEMAHRAGWTHPGAITQE